MASGTIVFSNPSLAVAENRRRKRRRKKKGKKNASTNRKGVRGMASRRNKKTSSSNRRRRRAGRSSTRRGRRRNPAPTTNRRRRRRAGATTRRRRRRNPSKSRSNIIHRRRPRRSRRRRRSRRNPVARRNQLRGIGKTFASIPRRFASALPAVLGGAVLFRIDDLFSDRITELVGVEADSLPGKGIRAGTLILAGILLDGVLGGRKVVSWTWGELFTNVGLIKMAAELVEDQIEPAIFGRKLGEPEPAPILAPEEETPVTPPISGFRGRMGRANGMGRGHRGMGALVAAAPPIFG